MMNRTFQHTPSWVDWVSMLLFLGGAMMCFWYKSNPALLCVGVLLIIVLLRSIDRAFYTEYTITDDELQIRAGRVAKVEHIGLSMVKEIAVETLLFGGGKVVLLILDDGRSKGLLVENPDAVKMAIEKRIPEQNPSTNEKL